MNNKHDVEQERATSAIARAMVMLLLGGVLMGCQTQPSEPDGGMGTDDSVTTEPPDPSGTSVPTPPDAIDRTPITIYDPGYASYDDGTAVSSVVYFAYDRSALPLESRAVLNAHAGYLRNHPQRTVLVEGHCDERGTREYNLALGERRANAVRDYLLGEGVRSGQIDTVSYGEEKPVDAGSDEEAYRQNRRAQISYRK